MVCSLLTTWGPPSIVSNVAIAGDHAPHVAPRKALCLKFHSSLLNPIIYWIMNPQFKEAFKKALRCWCYGNHDAHHNHARDVAEVMYTFLLSVVILRIFSLSHARDKTKKQLSLFLYRAQNLPSLLFLSTNITLSTYLILAVCRRVSYELRNRPRSPWSLCGSVVRALERS